MLTTRERVGMFGKHMLWLIIETVFLALWVVIQWSVDTFVIQRFQIDAFHHAVLQTFQVLFAVTTFWPIAHYTFYEMLGVHYAIRASVRELKVLENSKSVIKG
jgi:hypothetical protein